MGSINYRSSDYITMALNCLSSWDIEHDTDLIEELQSEIDEYGGTLESAIDDYINTCIEEDQANIEYELKKHSFHYFTISIKQGYYEGFSLFIEFEQNQIYDYTDKRQAQKEITEIKAFLLSCAGMGLQACFPGWVTSWFDYKDTCKRIKQASKKMRETVSKEKTWLQVERGY